MIGYGTRAWKNCAGLGPGLLEPWLAEAIAAHQAGRLAEAEALYGRVLAQNPDHPDALHLIGVIALQAGNYAAAATLIGRALALRPGSGHGESWGEGHALVALACKHLGRLGEAIEHYRRSLAARPDHAETLRNLALALSEAGDGDGAVEALRQAVVAAPQSGESLCALGNALQDRGELAAAIDGYRRALGLDSGLCAARRNLATALLYDPGADAGTRFAAQRALAMAVSPSQSLPALAVLDCGPERRLRLGYLGSDFREHPVARNLLPVLEGHDRSRFEVVLYADLAQGDVTTQRCRDAADLWRPVAGLADSAVAERIGADGIDILICLAGHFDRNRPQVAAWRPASVQVSFHDVASSAIQGMDYLIADRFLVPRAAGLERFSERVVRLPTFFLHPPLACIAPPGPLPALAGDGVTFGCFNNPVKLSEAALSLWARVLRAVPSSRLVLKYKHLFGSAALARRLRARFEAEGVTGDRLILNAERLPLADHLALYRSIDIALDPFPFSGSTASFEALAMGVPVVTLPWPCMAGRWTAAMLARVGLEGLIAGSADEYVAICARLAGDLVALARLRAALPARLAASPLCDARARTRQLERVYRALWRRAVKGDTLK
ncbi:protein O-GlcNAc transferase [uncultured Gammaproteobacteria bacterium]